MTTAGGNPPQTGTAGRPDGGAPRGRVAADSTGRRLLALGLATSLMVLAFLLMRSTGHDDSYITFWAARALRETGEIQNLSGVRFEQSSSALMTFLLAFLAWISPVSVPVLGWCVSVVAGVVSIYLTGSLAELLRPGTRVFGVLAGGLLFPVTYWSLSGMENTLTAALLSWLMIVALRYPYGPWRRPWVLYAVVGPGSLALALVRPDTPLYWLGAWLILWVAALLVPRTPSARQHLDAEDLRRLRSVSATFTVAIALSLTLVFAWRLAYFGALFPGPVSAKVSGLDIQRGLDQAGIYVLETPALLLIAIAALVSPYALRRLALSRWLPAWVVAGVYAAGVVSAGGGWMELARLFVAVMPLGVALTIAAFELPSWERSARVALIGLLVCSMVLGIWGFSAGTPVGATLTAPFPEQDRANGYYSALDQYNRVHYKDEIFAAAARPTIEAIARATGGVSVASSQAGVVAYYALYDVPNVTFIDLKGLASPALASCTTRYAARGPYGYSLTWTKLLTVGWSACGLDPPDVIFDLGAFSNRIAPFSHDYCVVTQTDGHVTSSAGWVGPLGLGSLLAGTYPISNLQFVAVRADLLPLVSDQPCASS